LIQKDNLCYFGRFFIPLSSEKSRCVGASISQLPDLPGAAAETQRSPRNILINFGREYGDKQVGMLKRQHVVAMFNKKSEKGFAVRNWLKTVHAPMQFAFNNGWLTDDPTLGVKICRATPAVI